MAFSLPRLRFHHASRCVRSRFTSPRPPGRMGRRGSPDRAAPLLCNDAPAGGDEPTGRKELFPVPDDRQDGLLRAPTLCPSTAPAKPLLLFPRRALLRRHLVQELHLIVPVWADHTGRVCDLRPHHVHVFSCGLLGGRWEPFKRGTNWEAGVGTTGSEPPVDSNRLRRLLRWRTSVVVSQMVPAGTVFRDRALVFTG